MLSIKKIKLTDFKLYIFFTGLATAVNLFSIYILTLKFGKDQFADYVYYTVFTQIIFTLSDFGIKNSFFSEIKNHKKINYVYLLLIKLSISLLLFFLFFSYFRNLLFVSNLFTVVGTALVPNFLLHEKGLFRLIGINNLIYRTLPLLFLPLTKNIIHYNTISGLILIFSALVIIYYNSGVQEFAKIKFQDFIKYFWYITKSNKYLSLVNIINVLEINLHILLSRQLFDLSSFSTLIQVDRYVNFIKQVIIYYYEYLFPKINGSNYIIFQNHIKKLARVLVSIILLTCFSFILYAVKKESNLIYEPLILLFCLYPLSILVFNFIPSILFLKYCSDNLNFKIVFIVFLIKFLIFLLFFNLGIIIVPLILILSEIVFGVFKYSNLSKFPKLSFLKFCNV